MEFALIISILINVYTFRLPMIQNHSISVIDLFCGIGGLTCGLEKVGIPVKLGIDIDESCKFAYESNNQAIFLAQDISKIEGVFLNEQFWNKNEIKVLVGCAPCQPFSTHQNKNKNRERHKKWNMLNEFSRLIDETQPEIVSMENVPNLKNQEIFKEFVSHLKANNYYVWFANVFCPDYGIPQKRRRLVLLASKLGIISLNSPTHKPKDYVSVKKAIGNLEKLENGFRSEKDSLHFTTELTDINLKRIKSSKPNGTWEDWDESLMLECHKKDSGKSYKSVYGRMSWDEPSPTITTQFYNYGTGRFGHPEQNRAITIREGAILQTFPKTYRLVPKDRHVSINKLGVHIGNAVPVKLGEVIGKSILSHLEYKLNG